MAEIVKRVASGQTQKVIATELGISKKTVSAHLASAYRRLRVRNTVELTHFAIRTGLVALRD